MSKFEAEGHLLTKYIEGDDTGYGQALFPVPADDPNDPLQVRTRLPWVPTYARKVKA